MPDQIETHTQISVSPEAFYGYANNVTVKNLVIEKYATPSQYGAVHGRAAWPPAFGFAAAQGIVTAGRDIFADVSAH